MNLSFRISKIKKRTIIVVLSLLISMGLNISLLATSEAQYKAAYMSSNHPFQRFLLGLANSASPNNVNTLLVTAFVVTILLTTIKFHGPRWFNFATLLLSALISTYSLLALSFQYTGTWDLVVSSSFPILGKALLKWMSLTFFLFQLAKLPLIFKKNILLLFSSDKPISKNKKTSFWRFFFWIFVAWLFYLIVLFPGSASWDTLNQFSEFFGKKISWVYPTAQYLLHSGQSTISDHHPFLLTLYYGGLIKFGVSLGSEKIGLFLITLIQTLYTIAIFSMSLVTFETLKLRRKTINILFYFYCFFPLFPLYAMYQVKNSIYGPTLLWFCLLVIKALIDNNQLSKTSWRIMMVVNLLLQVISIKYGFYVAIISSLVAILVFHHNWKSVLFFMIVPVIAFRIAYSSLSTTLNIIPGDPIEMYSIPLQQTGRYLKYYPNDVTKHEKKVLSKMFVIDNIAGAYTPEVSDAMKSGGGGSPLVYKYPTVTKKDMADYKKVWFKMMFRHPGIYLEAFFNQTYEYFNLYPETNLHSQNLAFDQFPLNVPKHDKNQYVFHTSGHKFSSNYSQSNKFGRNIIINLLNFLVSIPGVSLLFRGTSYVFFALLILSLMFANRLNLKYLTVFVPILLQLGVCILSPVNGSQRYLYPFIYCGPFLFVLFLLVVRTIDIRTSNGMKSS